MQEGRLTAEHPTAGITEEGLMKELLST
jgi:hypothetical protein